MSRRGAEGYRILKQRAWYCELDFTTVCYEDYWDGQKSNYAYYIGFLKEKQPLQQHSSGTI